MNGLAKWTGWLLIVAALALAGGGSAARQDSDATTSVLRGDERLLKRVTVQAAFVTLQEALQQVGQAAGVRLRADEKLAGENVLVLTGLAL